jgi:tripartite motif-containing protein 2/3
MNRVTISNIRTGALVCRFGKHGRGEGQFHQPWGVAVTSDSSFVIVADCSNNRIKVLRLVIAVDKSSAHLEFVRHIGAHLNFGSGIGEGRLLRPTGVALLPGEAGGQETVLVMWSVRGGENEGVFQFKLDGTFIRIFANPVSRRTPQFGNEDDDQFKRPKGGITVLGLLEEVAVADYGNHRVQIFDLEGNYKRQFGNKGRKAEEIWWALHVSPNCCLYDGELCGPSALASDAHGNLLVLDDTPRLQVFSPEGKHLCTRNDLGLSTHSTTKGVAWSAVGELAIAVHDANHVLVWRNEYRHDTELKKEGETGFDCGKWEHDQKGAACMLLVVVLLLLLLLMHAVPTASAGMAYASGIAAPAGMAYAAYEATAQLTRGIHPR